MVAGWCATCGGWTGWDIGFVYFSGQLTAEYANSTTYFVHPDDLGSTRLLTGLDQSVVQAVDYLPFGELNSSNSWDTWDFFTGLERDSETNLDHTQFLQYSSQLGRWMTPDPAGLAATHPANPQSWNLYSYVMNGPLTFTDPFGLCGGGPGAVSVTIGGTATGNGVTTTQFYTSDPCLSGVGAGGGGGFTLPCFGFYSMASGPGCPPAPPPPPPVVNKHIINANGQTCIPSLFDPNCKRPTCIAVFLDSAANADPLGKVLDKDAPKLPPEASPDEAVKIGAATAAVAYSTSQGLTVPLRSSIVRNILAAGEGAAEAAIAVPVLYQEFVGVNAEREARKA